MVDDSRRLRDGGAKERPSSLEDRDEDPALRHEGRQAVRNQGRATPEDYPDRDEQAPT